MSFFSLQWSWNTCSCLWTSEPKVYSPWILALPCTTCSAFIWGWPYNPCLPEPVGIDCAKIPGSLGLRLWVTCNGLLHFPDSHHEAVNNNSLLSLQSVTKNMTNIWFFKMYYNWIHYHYSPLKYCPTSNTSPTTPATLWSSCGCPLSQVSFCIGGRAVSIADFHECLLGSTSMFWINSKC